MLGGMGGGFRNPAMTPQAQKLASSVQGQGLPGLPSGGPTLPGLPGGLPGLPGTKKN
jgi:hypothetical protein